MKTLSVCIVSYNTRDLLLRCVAAVEREGASEILVADNASADGSAEAVARNFPKVRLTPHATNLHYTRAMNELLETAQGERVLLLNPDTEPQPGALDALQNALDENGEWGAAGARLEFPDGALQRTGNRFFTQRDLLYDALGVNARRPTNATHLQNIYAEWDRTTLREVDALSGACLMVRRQVIQDVGLLDERFAMYFEEVDWCRRMRARGWRVGYVPSARVMHHAEQSARQLPSAQSTALYETSMVEYARKYCGTAFADLLSGTLRTKHTARRLLPRRAQA